MIWIDAGVRPGKAPGAFAHPTVPGAHPYLLLNYQGRTRDVMTLAHELGAAINQSRSLGAILQRAARDIIEIRLVILAKVRGVRERHATLVAHPRDRSRCVEPARERNSDALADWERGEDGSP